MPQAELSFAAGGEWSDLFEWPLIGIHTILTPDNKILSFGTDQQGQQGAQFIYDVWDPATNTHDTLPNTTPTDLFCCCAIVVPSTGEILITGGDARPLGHVNVGVADVNVFDYHDNSLSPSTEGPMAYQRWYPTSIELANGKILVLGGVDINGHGVGMPELYTPGSGWKSLTGAYSQIVANDPYYPRAWLALDGKVFMFNEHSDNGTPASVVVLDPSGNGTLTQVATLPFATTWQFPAIKFAPDKVLILDSQGGAWVMNMSGDTPTFQQTGSLGEIRDWSNLTILADGSVMVSGGSDVDNQLINVHNEVQIWNPTTGVWTTGDSAAVARLYHSTTILLPDATVLSLGGGAPGPETNTNGEIYKPGYLFNADGTLAERPLITSAPTEIKQQQTLTITVDNAADITRLTFAKTGAVTHSLDVGASFIDLQFTHGDGNTLIVTVPNNANVLVPGNWMLFAFNSHGTPSVAATIDVGLGGENYSAGFHGYITTSGDAAYDTNSDIVTLTPDAANKSGAVFSNDRIDLHQNFTISFNAYLGNKDSGGAGIAFVLQNDPSGSDAFGNGGTVSQGAGGISNGLAISLDTYKDKGETSSDHSSIFDTDATPGSKLTSAKSLSNLENAKWHSVSISWDVDSQTLTYFIDGKKAGTLTGDLATQYFGGSDYVYYGITGATGSGKNSNLQQVKMTGVTVAYAPTDAPLKTSSPQMAGNVHTSGNAGYNADTDVFLLTPTGSSKTGAIISETKIDLHSNVDITFNFYLGSKDGGSQGATFVLQNDPSGANAIGSGGAGLGANGIKNGLAIQFDTNRGSDKTSFFDTDAGSTIRSLTPSVSVGNLENGHWHQAHVIWDVATQSLQYWVDGKFAGALTGDLATTYFGGSNLVNFGFTGATGSGGNLQEVHITHLDAVTGNGTHNEYGVLTAADGKPFIDKGAFDLVTTTRSASFDATTGLVSLTSTKSQTGSAFSNAVLDVHSNFSISFNFFAGTKDSGGEGLAFVLQNDPLGGDALGGTGSALGAGGIVNGLGIEFDTRKSTGDISADHTNFFDTDLGTNAGKLSPQIALANLEDGKWHNTLVSWDADTQTLSYWIDGNLGGTLTGDLAQQYFGGSNLVHFGFTGATSTAFNTQQVVVTEVNGDLLSPEYFVNGHVQPDAHAHA